MKKMTTEILVIGGGATGVGVLWDAALRGFDAILVERRDLNHGTSGRFHGLLHSGGRYVVKDPISARECIAENRILRQTHPQCIEETGGFFVVTPEDEGDYPDRFVQACAETGVPCEEISVAEARRREPRLNPRISRVFRVPDASIDGFQLGHATAQGARQAGARILTYHEVTALIVTGGEGDQRVVGAWVQDVARGEEVIIHADLVISATGAWAGRITNMAGVRVDVIPGKGIMIATAHRLVNTVINRCKMPSDGDILVPAHTVSIIGTTDVRVAHPEDLRIESWEVELLLAEGEKLISGFTRTRILRVWAGVRPLYQEHYAGASRDATRQFALLDHRTRDGVAGLLTITGGKLTTFRLMAEKTVDKAAAYLGARQPCITDRARTPGAEHGFYWLGHRLREVEDGRLQNQLICECELVTRGMLEQAVRNNPTITLDDLRRDVRLGMGPCQGGFCTYRAVGVIHEMKLADADAADSPWDMADAQSPGQAQRQAMPSAAEPPQRYNPNLLLHDFLQERWKGVAPIVWGQQLKQEQLDRLIYLSLMNVDHLPDATLKSPLSDFYRAEVMPLAAAEDAHE